MRIKFGISIGYIPMLIEGRDLPKFMELATMADDYGFDVVGTYDSAFIGGDAFSRATLIGLATKRARVGLRPTNPVTREPQVMAAFLASLDSMTDGRAFIDLATGDSAVFNAGLRPSTRDRMQSYITCIRELLSTGISSFDGRVQRVRWSSTVRPDIPIWVTAEGPKMLRLAGSTADCVVAGTGLTPEIVQDTKARIADAARQSERDPNDIEIWFTTRTSLDTNRELANENVAALVAGILNHSMRFGVEGKFVPESLKPRVKEFVARYAVDDHVVVQGANEELMDSLGLTSFATNRWAITGNVSDWIRRIEEIAAAGATNLWITLGRDELPHQRARMRLLGEQILPQFR